MIGDMDLSLYFNPVDFELLNGRVQLNRHMLGYTIRKDTMKYGGQVQEGVRIVLAGIPREEGTVNKGCADAPAVIREHLYRLSHFEHFRGIVDLGDLKPGRNSRDLLYALRDVTGYLSEAGIILVVMGGGQDLSIGISRAFQGSRDFVLSVADARVDIKMGREVTGSGNFLSRILRENPLLFHLQVIGIQRTLVPPAALAFLNEQTFEAVSLGQLRDDIRDAEPLLRNTTFLSFDISSVKLSGVRGRSHPNGFSAEEACQLVRYAGLSTRMAVFGLFEVNPHTSEDIPVLAAEIIWYFLEAVIHRRKEDPATDKSLFTRYFVEMEGYGEPLVFYYHPPTNRWWIEIMAEEGDSWIAPCRESDYQTAIKQEIPDIWWKYARKSERLSKY